MKKEQSFITALYLALALACLLPQISSATALLLGISFVAILPNPFLSQNKIVTKKLLTYSVMGLGAGMNLKSIIDTGFQSISYTIIGILSVLGLGWILAKILKSDSETSTLISVGTAICGGSAIAAISPVIKAKNHSITVALAVVFLLNSFALVIFPLAGHHFELSQTQFGLWAALAIHDTSSVVGATLQYGSEALKVGATVKLSRALWIVAITPAFAYLYRNKSAAHSETKTQKPWFILGFIVLAALFTYLPQLTSLGTIIEWSAKRTLTLTLFLIGSSLSISTIKKVGVTPIILGILLWITVSVTSLIFIKQNWIRVI